jgi:hypothetical protein
MIGTYAAFSLLVVFAFSLLIIRIGTIALVMTGVSSDRAFFQSISAFSGVGFTTQEAEDVMSTASRRRIIRTLILLGNIGIVTGIATLVLSFTGDGSGNSAFRLAYLAIGTGSLILLARSRWFDRLVTPVIEWGLDRTTSFDHHDYRPLLRLRRGYRVAEIYVDENNQLTNRTLEELNRNAEGVVALDIRRPDDSYLGVPGENQPIKSGDTLLAYGHKDRLQKLAECEGDDGRKRRSP